MTPDKRTEYLDKILGLSHIDSTKSHMKEACLIQKNIVEFLETKIGMVHPEDPEPLIRSLSEERKRLEVRVKQEAAQAQAVAALQCEPASVVDVQKASREPETIQRSVSDFDVFEVQGRPVDNPRPYGEVFAEYQSHAKTRPPEPQGPVSTKNIRGG